MRRNSAIERHRRDEAGSNRETRARKRTRERARADDQRGRRKARKKTKKVEEAGASAVSRPGPRISLISRPNETSSTLFIICRDPRASGAVDPPRSSTRTPLPVSPSASKPREFILTRERSGRSRRNNQRRDSLPVIDGKLT